MYLFSIASPTCLVSVYLSLSITSSYASSASGGIPCLDITEHVQYIKLPGKEEGGGKTRGGGKRGEERGKGWEFISIPRSE